MRKLTRQGVELLLIVVLMSLFGCSGHDGDVYSVHIQLERLSDDRGFRAVWTVDHPVNSLVFTRTSDMRRRNFWKVSSPSMRFEGRGDTEVLISESLTQRFEVLISDEKAVPGATDYPLLTPFSDQGMVIYTGYFHAVAMECRGSCSDRTLRNATKVPIHPMFTLKAAEHETVYTNVGPSSVDVFPRQWQTLKTIGEGQFSYFGKQKLHRTPSFDAIVDPQLPAWILREIEAVLPILLKLNTTRLKQRLLSKPLLFLAYQGNVLDERIRYSGFVVGSDVSFALSGKGWETRTSQTREELVHLLAHETFHLWNANLFKSVERAGGGWLHEGSAEALAQLSLYEMGVIDLKRYRDRQGEALNRCLIDLAFSEFPPMGLGRRSSRSSYTCGAVIQYLAGHAVSSRGQGEWVVWRQIFDLAKRQNNYYTHDDFFLVGQRLERDAQTFRRIGELTSGFLRSDTAGPSLSAETYLMGAFRQVGQRLTMSDAGWPLWYHQLVLEQALSSLMRRDCANEGSVFVDSQKAVLAGNAGCHLQKFEREITHVGDYDVVNEGVQVYDLIYQMCSTQSRMPTIRARDGSLVEATCPALPKRPQFLQFR